MSNLNLKMVADSIDIPTVITVVNMDTDIAERIRYGAAIINVAGGAQTPEIVKMVREAAPGIPIIASGGKTEESIRRTIQAGANAITYTPPTTQELFTVHDGQLSGKFRDQYGFPAPGWGLSGVSALPGQGSDSESGGIKNKKLDLTFL